MRTPSCRALHDSDRSEICPAQTIEYLAELSTWTNHAEIQALTIIALRKVHNGIERGAGVEGLAAGCEALDTFNSKRIFSMKFEKGRKI
jgi:hypothetical protein